MLKLASKIVWDLEGKWFGGISGLEMSPDGASFVAITDRGRLLKVTLQRRDNKITAIRLLSNEPLLHTNGKRLRGSVRDAEGLAFDTHGNAYVSFEFRHRITRLNIKTGTTARLPAQPPHLDQLEVNAGYEALAIHPDGRLFAVPEGNWFADGHIPIYVYTGSAWKLAYQLQRKGPFRPVGADFDDAGRLYLLERTVSLLGFRTRIRRFDFTGDTVRAETLLTTIPGRFDNLEGLSVWQDATDTTRITTISDDNFLSLQETQLVEFILTR